MLTTIPGVDAGALINELKSIIQSERQDHQSSFFACYLKYLIRIDKLARQDQDEADEPDDGSHEEDEASDFGGIAKIVSICTFLKARCLTLWLQQDIGPLLELQAGRDFANKHFVGPFPRSAQLELPTGQDTTEFRIQRHYR